MKIAKLIALVGLLAMTGVLIYGFTFGDFAAEGAKLLAMPWGDRLAGGSLRWICPVLVLDGVSRESAVAIGHLGHFDDGVGFCAFCSSDFNRPGGM